MLFSFLLLQNLSVLRIDMIMACFANEPYKSDSEDVSCIYLKWKEEFQAGKRDFPCPQPLCSEDNTGNSVSRHPNAGCPFRCWSWAGCWNHWQFSAFPAVKLFEVPWFWRLFLKLLQKIAVNSVVFPVVFRAVLIFFSVLRFQNSKKMCHTSLPVSLWLPTVVK